MTISNKSKSSRGDSGFATSPSPILKQPSAKNGFRPKCNSLNDLFGDHWLIKLSLILLRFELFMHIPYTTFSLLFKISLFKLLFRISITLISVLMVPDFRCCYPNESGYHQQNPGTMKGNSRFS